MPINGSIVLNNRDPMDMIWVRRLTPQQAPLTSPQIDLQVSPLPTDNVPPGFNGAVGSYTMAVTAGPTNLVAGDPITLHIQISGHGALDSIALPEQPGWDNFKTYPPTAKVNATDQLRHRRLEDIRRNCHAAKQRHQIAAGDLVQLFRSGTKKISHARRTPRRL